MKKIKRILSVWLVCCMMVGLLPLQTFAADIVASGYCGGEGDGTNLSWTLDSEGTLTISGMGAMPNWGIGLTAPWNYYPYNQGMIRNVIIEDGVANIGTYSFEDCFTLDTISIPSSVTEIGYDAFSGCTSLKQIELPSTIEEIGSCAFQDCESLASINIPNNVKSVGFDAFKNTAYYNDKNNWENGALYLDDWLIAISDDLPEIYQITDGTVGICDGVFEYSAIVSVTIPVGITRIPIWCFAGCASLSSVSIPTGVFEIGDWAFTNCIALESIVLPEGVTTIGECAFELCKSLNKIVIPKTVERIETGSFRYHSYLDVYYAGSKRDWEDIYIDEGEYGSGLLNATTTTIHYNSTGPDDSTNTGKLVSFLSSWNSSTRQIVFDYNADIVSPYTYTIADGVDISNIDSLVSRYVLVTEEQGESVLDWVVTDIQPVESAIGKVTATGEHSLTIGGTEYPVREDYILGKYDGQEVLYHIYEGTIMGFDVLEEKSGKLEGWNSTTGRVTINGTEYPTNFLTDMSFLGHIEEYLGENVTYFVSGDDSYRPLIRIDGVVEVENEIAVFSTEKSLTVKTGDSMWLGFGKIADGEIVGDWKRMAIVVSDPTVISLSEYEETEYGYSLEVTGKKQGATNVTITDTESGAHTIIVITVRDSYVGTYSYAIDNMETFYPNNEWEGSVQTNIYNLNGLYVNNYQESKTGAAYTVSFDVYNSQYHTGAVDIYDADGNWIDCEEIKKFSMISSLWDTGEQAYYLISDAVSGKLLTYEQASFAEHTSISIEVPDGGYFTISNNFAESPGAFLFNSCEILYDGTCTLIDAALDIKNDKVALSAFSDLVKSEITIDKTVREQFIDIFKKTAKKEAQKCLKKFAINEIDDRYADISGLFENLLNSLDISWKHLFKSATGMGESAFTKFAGPAGVALKGCFAFTKGGNQLVQAVHLAASVDAPYVTVFSSIREGEINPHGVIVNTNGNMDAEAVLQVFRVSNNDTIEVVLDGDGDHLQKYELYNICFVKDDQLVQPNGKVTVRIPIPDGMKGDTCCVYRQESDGTWTILTAHIEGNYLVFETDHFSLYGVVGDADELKVSSLPTKTVYSAGDTLDPDGLVLSLGDMLIADGFICEPTVLAQSGTQTITVRYGVASTEFSVSVQTNSDDDSSGGGSTGSSTGGSSSSGGSTGGSTGGGSSGGSTSTPSDLTTDDPVAPSEPDEPTIPDFTDVSSDAWYYEAVQYVAERGLMNGYGNGKFGPNDNVTRAQFAQIIYNKEGKPAVTKVSSFTDVVSGAWYFDAVTWAADNKVVNGYGNGKYGPDDEITREQLAVMLWRYAGQPETSGSLSQFADGTKTSSYAMTALEWAVENGIVNGKGNGVLDPQGKATRAEVAAMLMRYCENVQKGE